MPIQVGSYSILSGKNTPTSFWPLAPTDTPFLSQSLFLPPGDTQAGSRTRVGIFDIVIQMSQDDIVTSNVEAQSPSLPDTWTEADPTVTTMPLLWEGDGSTRRSRIRFAVMMPEGRVPQLLFFSGTLRLSAAYRNSSGKAVQKQLDVALRIGPGEHSDDMFIFFIVHPVPPLQYCWSRLRAVEASSMSTPVSGAVVEAMVLRDNLGGTHSFSGINRVVALQTNTEGYLSSGGRTTLALPIDWPIIFRASVPPSPAAPGYVRRAHMLRFTQANLKNNTQQTPLVPDSIQFTRVSNAQLGNRRFLLDAGHGVLYAYKKARRSFEWFGAHLVADRVAHLLRTRHGVPDANIFWTRSAGLGLIEPGSVTAQGAPDTGAARYEFDLAQRRIRIRDNKLGLRDLSNLLLTRHVGDNHQAQPVTAQERTRLLQLNTATIDTIIERLSQQLKSKHGRVQTGSVSWDATRHNYVYTQEFTPAKEGATAPAPQVLPFPIGTHDWFDVDEGMLRILADRTARWSLECETNGTGSFPTAARKAMRENNFLDYARTQILRYLNVTAPHAWLNHGLQAWGPDPRIAYMNALNPPCDIYISFHLNAGAASSKGQMLLVDREAPPNEQIRLSKIFVKYVDPLGLGTRQGGITKELKENPAALLGTANLRRDRHAYFELEFFDAAHSSGQAGQYRYSELVQDPCIQETAEQIVAGIIEALLNRQPNLDPVIFNGQLGTPKLW